MYYAVIKDARNLFANCKFVHSTYKTMKILYFTFACIIPFLSVSAQNRIGTGAVQSLYDMHCASCHGKDLKGGLGSSLLSGTYKKIGPELSFSDYIKAGNVEMGMPGFEALLDDSQIRSLEVYIDEMKQKENAAMRKVPQGEDGVYQAGGYQYRLEDWTTDVERPWSISFASNDSAFVTEKGGVLKFISPRGTKIISGLPEVWVHGQGGLLEVALHPDYTENGWVYLSFSASSGELNGRTVGITKVVRGRIKEYAWVDEETIFEVPLEFQSSAGTHFGSRFVFQDGYLFFGIGDRGAMNMAQDLSRPNGKIHRIHDDGRVPVDNPFVNTPKAYPTIWTYGNRNPQGLELNPWTGDIWESEHGPRGGDEINLIERGVNYGWPVITYGINYNGEPISGITEKAGMAQPEHYWTPSIAVCGIDFYEGDLFPDWTGDLFVGGLASQELHRLVIEDRKIISDEIILKDAGRVRDVASGPDGALYLVLNGPDKIVRLVPASR